MTPIFRRVADSFVVQTLRDALPGVLFAGGIFQRRREESGGAGRGSCCSSSSSSLAGKVTAAAEGGKGGGAGGESEEEESSGSPASRSLEAARPRRRAGALPSPPAPALRASEAIFENEGVRKN